MKALAELKHMSSLDIEFEMTLYAVLVSVDQTKDSGIRECNIDPLKDIVFSDGKWFVRIDLNGFTWPLYADYGFYMGHYGYPDLMHSNDNQDYISWRLLRALIEFEYERVNTPKKQKAIKTYLMRDSDTGLTKIGRAEHPRFRESTLQSQRPVVKLIAVSDCNYENLLHKKYDDQRVRGEWFNLSDNDISEICVEYAFKLTAPCVPLLSELIELKRLKA